MPRKADPNSRTKVITTRYSEAEFKAIKQYAQSLDIPTRTLTEVYPKDPNQLTITDKVDQCTD